MLDIAYSSPTPETLTPEECQRRLIEASNQYMHGEISLAAFEDVERLYMPDYESVFVSVAGWFTRCPKRGKRFDRSLDGHETVQSSSTEDKTFFFHT